LRDSPNIRKCMYVGGLKLPDNTSTAYLGLLNQYTRQKGYKQNTETNLCCKNKYMRQKLPNMHVFKSTDQISILLRKKKTDVEN
jgi:hypothetical protein